MSNPEIFDIVTVHDNILKSASPKAQRIITENQLWFSHFYFIATDDDSDDDDVVNDFWSSLKSPLVMEDRPNWFVPHPVLIELVDICRKDYDLYKKH